MDNILTKFEHELITQFDVMIAGQLEPAITIILNAPSSKNLIECSMLKQAFFRSLPDSDKVDVDTDATIEDMAGEDIILLLSMSKVVELSDVLIVAKKLFSAPGIGIINKDTKLSSAIIDQISINDLEIMLGEYLVNFILASALKRMKEKQLEVSQI